VADFFGPPCTFAIKLNNTDIIDHIYINYWFFICLRVLGGFLFLLTIIDFLPLDRPISISRQEPLDLLSIPTQDETVVVS